jgi:type I restriction enzyme S subunit
MPKNNLRRLGDYIREVDVRNRDLKVTKLVGLIIDKAFIPSVANVIGTDLSNYKVMRRNQFTCSLMQVSRDGKMPVAMFDEDAAIMSPAYPMFEVVDENKLLPEYLMMLFCRSEFDREACFYAVGGVRGSLTWEDFCNMEILVPGIKTQRQIVEQYQTLETRIQNNKKLCTTLEQTAQALYTQTFVEGIDKEHLPEGWKLGKMSDLIDVRDGTHDSPKTSNEGFALITSQHLLPWSVDIENAYFISEKDYNKINERSLVEQNDILFSMIGTVGLISYVLYEKVEFAVKNMAFSKLLKRRIMQSSFCLP